MLRLPLLCRVVGADSVRIGGFFPLTEEDCPEFERLVDANRRRDCLSGCEEAADLDFLIDTIVDRRTKLNVELADPE